MTYQNPWIYQNEIFDPDDEFLLPYVGFVYLLENTTNGKMYVGKKFFWMNKYKMVNKKKKKFRAQSKWRDYYGSSHALLSDISNVGIDKIDRTVLLLCKSKTECSYYEMQEQFDRKVLLDDCYYNNFIGGKINGNFLRK